MLYNRCEFLIIECIVLRTAKMQNANIKLGN